MPEQIFCGIEFQPLIDPEFIEPSTHPLTHPCECGPALRSTEGSALGLSKTKCTTERLVRNPGLLPSWCEADKYDASRSVGCPERYVVDRKPPLPTKKKRLVSNVAGEDGGLKVLDKRKVRS